MAGFTDEMRAWMRCVVQNKSRKEIMQEVFHVAPEDLGNEEVLHKYDNKMCRWRQHPDYQKEWINAFKSLWGPIMAKAMKVVDEGLDDSSLPWRATQHANMALAYGTKLIVGEEERAINVKIEGMPEIGSPDDA